MLYEYVTMYSMNRISTVAPGYSNCIGNILIVHEYNILAQIGRCFGAHRGKSSTLVGATSSHHPRRRCNHTSWPKPHAYRQRRAFGVPLDSFPVTFVRGSHCRQLDNEDTCLVECIGYCCSCGTWYVQAKCIILAECSRRGGMLLLFVDERK